MSIENPQKVNTVPIKLLHIDDDPSVLDLTGSFLEMELDAVELTTATGPADGLEQIHAKTFHCIVSDYEMPGRDGLELLAEVREQYPNLPFILYTGKGSEEIAAEAINAGVTGYFQKGGPNQIRRLANRVRHAAAEHRTRIESERYSTVLRALEYPVYVVDSEAEFEYVNKSFVDLTGYSREEIIGSSPGLIKTEQGVQTANDMLAEIISSSGPDKKKFSVDIQTADGDIVPCYDHMAALPFDDEFRGSVGILRDATVEQQRREELLQQNKRLDEFTSIVSHDLRTPLGNAQTAAEMAQATGDDDAFDKLKTEHNRMEQMISDLLTLAREGQATSEIEPVDLAQIATEAWEPFCGTADTLNILEDEFAINAAPSRLRQLLENLMRNAVEHTPSPVTVTVGRFSDGFYIADDGPGIDPEQRDEIFEPGYTTAADGTGFGLPIVKRIADAHGWEVKITESKTGGAQFEVTAQSTSVTPTETPPEL